MENSITLIEFIQSHGHMVWVNPTHIAAIEPKTSGSRILVNGQWIYINEDVKKIAERIGAVLKEWSRPWRMPIEFDSTLSEDVIELRDSYGNVVGKMTGVGKLTEEQRDALRSKFKVLERTLKF